MGMVDGEAVWIHDGLAVGPGDGAPVGDPGSVDGIADGVNDGPVGVSDTADGRTDGYGVGLPGS